MWLIILLALAGTFILVFFIILCNLLLKDCRSSRNSRFVFRRPISRPSASQRAPRPAPTSPTSPAQPLPAVAPRISFLIVQPNQQPAPSNPNQASVVPIAESESESEPELPDPPEPTIYFTYPVSLFRPVCTICGKSIPEESAVRLSCSHKFHRECTKPDENNKLKCPRCGTISLVEEAPRECSICLNDIDKKEDTASLTCDHHFHASCIKEWMGHSNTCPMCRAVIAGSIPSASTAPQSGTPNSVAGTTITTAL